MIFCFSSIFLIHHVNYLSQSVSRRHVGLIVSHWDDHDDEEEDDHNNSQRRDNKEQL